MAWRNEPRDSVELVVLSLLSEGPRHGYGIIKEIGARSGGQARVGPGVLYPLLKSLESSALIAGEWDAPADGEGRRRKQYRLTARGRKRLEQRLAAHRRYRAVIDALIGDRAGEEAVS